MIFFWGFNVNFLLYSVLNLDFMHFVESGAPHKFEIQLLFFLYSFFCHHTGMHCDQTIVVLFAINE